MANISVIDFARLGLSVKNEADIKESDLLKTGSEFCEAFSTSGFAYIINHGISNEIIEELHTFSNEFFSQSVEYKTRYCTESQGFCYDPLGEVTANPKRPYDYHEGIRFPAGPSEHEWPDIPNLRERIRSFQKLCETLIHRILTALGHGLKLKDKNLFHKSHRLIGKKGNLTTLKLLHYPPIADDVKLEENQIRIGEHSDFGSITILFQDAIGGLQIQKPDGDFADVPCIPGAALLNIGDMMQFWSGERLKSTVHRVLIPNDSDKRKRSRRSIVYFGIVDNDVPLEELEFEDLQSNSSGNKAALTSEEYFNKRFASTFRKYK